MKSLSACGLFIVLALSTQFGLAQSAVVLINEQPTRVTLENGEISTVQNKVPGHMKGFKKSKDKSFKQLPYQKVYGGQVDVAQVSEAPSAELPLEPQDSGYMEVASNALEEAVDFSSGSAILSADALSTIDNYAEHLKAGKSKSILLKSWYRSGDSRSLELVENRLEAVRAYLEAKGVPSNIILKSQIGSNRESKFVTVVLN